MVSAHVWDWFWRGWVIQAWIVAALWVWRGIAAVRGLPKVPNILRPEYDAAPVDGPKLTAIVPALNEEGNVGVCLESLLGQDYRALEIVAVNDRSTDRTGAVMEALAAKYPRRLRVIHVTELPAGWLGKTHAMALAAQGSSSEYVLFTDADVIYRRDALRRSMAYAVESGADHMVTAPTLILRSWDESALLGFFQVCGLWAVRLWKVADPKAKRDAMGVGAFNLMRRAAYEQVGGFEALRMEIIEDLGIARKIKKAGLKQRVVFGLGLVNVHWASGAMGVVRVVTKNFFSAFRFQVGLLALACIWLAAFFVLPVLGLNVPGARIASMISLVMVGVVYRASGKTSGISAWNAVLSPLAALLLVYALLRSLVITLWQGGVVWRGTFYSLKDLRENVASW